MARRLFSLVVLLAAIGLCSRQAESSDLLREPARHWTVNSLQAYIDQFVRVPRRADGEPASAPEPSTYLLSGLGLAMLVQRRSGRLERRVFQR